MAAIETAYSAAQTEAQCDDVSSNQSNTSDDAEFHIVIQDRTNAITMGDIYDALNTEFATVAADKKVARNSATFVISS